MSGFPLDAVTGEWLPFGEWLSFIEWLFEFCDLCQAVSGSSGLTQVKERERDAPPGV